MVKAVIVTFRTPGLSWLKQLAPFVLIAIEFALVGSARLHLLPGSVLMVGFLINGLLILLLGLLSTIGNLKYNVPLYRLNVESSLLVCGFAHTVFCLLLIAFNAY